MQEGRRQKGQAKRWYKNSVCCAEFGYRILKSNKLTKSITHNFFPDRYANCLIFFTLVVFACCRVICADDFALWEREGGQGLLG